MKGSGDGVPRAGTADQGIDQGVARARAGHRTRASGRTQSAGDAEAHLLTADGSDPLRSLAAALRKQAPPHRRTPYAEGLVALFPQELERDPASEYLARAHHDVPVHAEDFVAKAGTGPAARLRREVRAASLT